MSSTPTAHLEARATEAEKRLDAIECKLAGASGDGGLSRHLQTLQDIKQTLLVAKQEQAELLAANKALEVANGKLQYQLEILKRSVREGDEKLKAAAAGK